MELNPQRDPLLAPSEPPAKPSSGWKGPPGSNSGRPLGYKQEVSDRPVSLNRLTGKPDAKDDEIIQIERPWHTNAAYMFASGKYNAKQVARACDMSYGQVLNALKNDWFQEKIALIQRENGAGDIMDLFRSECHSSLVTLIEIRDDVKAPASVRRASAIDILHQVLGKPTQKIETAEVVASSDPVAEVARLERENAMLKQGGTSTSSGSN